MPERPSLALVLTAAPGSGALDDALVVQAAAHIEADRRISDKWLCPREAWQLLFRADAGEAPEPLRASVAALLGERPVDANIVPGDSAQLRKRLLVADMDSTIIEQECIDEIADFAGVKPQVAAITERAMRGEIPFEGALRERVALLAGLTEATLQRVVDQRIAIMPGAKALVATMRANGAYAALVSGGFTFFTGRIARAVGFDIDHANTLELRDGRLTGRVVEPILGREAKLEALQRHAGLRGLDAASTMAVGDGANDLAMIRWAGLGVAYRAKPIVAAEAAANIRHGDLGALLYLQGYRREDFRE
jgi:phosphoserine phosphatase